MEHKSVETANVGIVPASQNVQIDQNNRADETEIDLVELFFTLLHGWKWFLLSFLVGAALMGAYHTYLVTPTYQASTEIYITNTNSVISLQDLQVGAALTADYESIITSRPVLNKVISDLGLDVDYKELREMVSVSNPSNTHIIRTSVTTTDLALSRDIANDLLNVSTDRLYQIIGSGEPGIIEYSEAEAVENVTPGILKHMVLGGLVCMVLVAAILIMKMIMDSTIKTDDDVEKYLQVPVLSAVPFYKE